MERAAEEDEDEDDAPGVGPVSLPPFAFRDAEVSIHRHRWVRVAYARCIMKVAAFLLGFNYLLLFV